jgi:hypothetical protein
MPSLVADTHSAVWYLLQSPRLSRVARERMAATIAGGDPILVPSICLVEIIYLVEKNRIPQADWAQLQAALDSADAAYRCFGRCGRTRREPRTARHGPGHARSHHCSNCGSPESPAREPRWAHSDDRHRGHLVGPHAVPDRAASRHPYCCQREAQGGRGRMKLREQNKSRQASAWTSSVSTSGSPRIGPPRE